MYPTKPHILEGSRAVLLPMQVSHISALTAAANDSRIWDYMQPLMNSADVDRFVRQALNDQKHGHALPYSVYDKQTDSFVGSTRLFDMSLEHRQLEIGFTWYHPNVWRTRINTECKYLLLRHCFEVLDTIRVQLKTDLRNTRSQAAIARLGAKKEGILRQHRILHDGYIRDSVVFSILDQEWPSVKARLEGFLQRDTLKLNN